MKILCVLLVLLISSTTSKNFANLKTDKEGVSSNVPGAASVDAVAFGLANNDHYVLAGNAVNFLIILRNLGTQK